MRSAPQAYGAVPTTCHVPTSKGTVQRSEGGYGLNGAGACKYYLRWRVRVAKPNALPHEDSAVQRTHRKADKL